MPRIDPHGPHILWIEHEEIGMAGFVRGGFGRNPLLRVFFAFSVSIFVEVILLKSSKDTL